MIQNGMQEEGLAVVKAIRERYDGEKRNPWNEIECGSNYARSLSSYALLNAYSGFKFDMTQEMIGFAPVEGRPQPFRCFWSLEHGWGVFTIGTHWASLEVQGGRLPLKILRLEQIQNGIKIQATLSGKDVPVWAGHGELRFTAGLTISAGKTLVIRWEE